MKIEKYKKLKAMLATAHSIERTAIKLLMRDTAIQIFEDMNKNLRAN